MRKTILLSVLAGLLAVSCLKDGFNDFEALKHDITVEGTLHPTMGVPLAYGAISIQDIINMVQMSEAKIEVDANDIVTIVYDTAAAWHIDIESGKVTDREPFTKGGEEIVHVSKHAFNGSVDINLFDDIEFLDNAEIEVDSLKVNIGTYIKANARPDAIATLDSFHVHVYYDSLSIDVMGKDSSHITFALPDTVYIENLIAGEYIQLFDNTDISEAINIRPKTISYGARMNIAFESRFFAQDMSENQFVVDSIGINSVDIDATINVGFPVSAYINNLGYETDVDFAPSFDLGDLIIDSSMLFINCANSIPLSLGMRLQLIDSTGDTIGDLLSPKQTKLAGAQVAFDPTTQLYTSAKPTETQIQIPVTKKVLDNILNTKKLHISAELNTSATNNDMRKRVTIKAQDKLDVRIYAKVKPSYTLNTDNTKESNNNTKGTK